MGWGCQMAEGIAKKRVAVPRGRHAIIHWQLPAHPVLVQGRGENANELPSLRGVSDLLVKDKDIRYPYII